MITQIHDSTTCTAGFNSHPCEMCQLARKSAVSRSESPSEASSTENQPVGFLVPEPENVSARQQSPGMAISAPAFTSEWDSAPGSMTNYVERGNLRAVLFDVIDAGCTCESGERHPWELDDDPNDDERTEDVVNAQRVRFVDEVMRRLRSDPRTAEFWFQRGIHAGRVETLQIQNDDLREMARVARVGR